MRGAGTIAGIILDALGGGTMHGHGLAQIVKVRATGLIDGREAMLYPELHLLEARGLIASELVSMNSGAMRYYRLTETGRRVAAHSRPCDELRSARLSPAMELP